jgi:hypothetical protein
MRVCGKEGHLTLRVAPVGAMRVGLDEFPNSEAICGFLRGDANVLAHDFPFLFNLLDTAGILDRASDRLEIRNRWLWYLRGNLGSTPYS